MRKMMAIFVLTIIFFATIVSVANEVANEISGVQRMHERISNQ
jgi:uncharacterized membrane protein (DUF106 family)